MSSPILTVEPVLPVKAKLVRLWNSHGRRTVRAMTATSSGALVSGLLSALASKILAAQGGPAAIAMLATLQQARQGGLIAATMNGQTAVIQGASARSGQERREYLRTSALLFCAGTALVAAACILFPTALRSISGLAPLSDAAFRWLAVCVAFSSALIFLTSVLNTLGRIGTLAILQVTASLALVAGVAAAAPAFATIEPGSGSARLALVLAIAAAVPACAAGIVLAKSWPDWRDWMHGGGKLWSSRSASAFLSVSAAMLASGMIATGVLLGVRGRIIAQHGLSVAGWFDAAWNISMNHASLLLASLQTYCLPALSRAKSAKEQAEHMSGVLMLVMPAAALMISGIAIAKPWLVELLYVPSFHPASSILRWTLLGDYLKVGSWILSLPLLASADVKAFLLLDGAAYATFAGASVALGRWLPGGEAAGAAFVCMYAVHLAAGGMLARWRCGIRLRRGALAAWAAGVAVVSIVSAFTWNRI